MKNIFRAFPVLSTLAIQACSPSTTDEPVRAHHQYSLETEADIARIAGFENSGDWQPTIGTDWQSILHTEGDYALSVTSVGWTEVWSVPFPALGPIGDYLSFDFFKTQPSSWGGIQVVLRSTSQDLNWSWKSLGGGKLLNQLDSGEWLTLQFPLDAITDSEREVLASAPGLQVGIIVNAPPNTFLLDNLDFDRPASEPGGTGGGSGTGGGAGSGGTPPVDQDLVTNQGIFGFEQKAWTGRGEFVESQPYSFQEKTGTLSFHALAESELSDLVPREGKSALVVTVPAGEDGARVTASFMTPTLTNLDEVSDTVGFDIKIPAQPFTTNSSGYVKVMVNAPSIGIYNDWVGQAQLNGGLLYSGDFMRAQFPLPPHIKQKLETSTPYNDLRFQFILENVSPGDYGFDYFALREQFPPVVPPAPSKDADDILGFDNIAGWAVTGAEGVQLSNLGENGSSLCLSDFTWASVKSANLSTLSAVDGQLAMSVFLPEELPSNEALEMNAFLSIPSLGHYKVHLGHATQGGFAASSSGEGSDTSRLVTFELPEEVEADVREGHYGDLSIEFELSLARNLGAEAWVCLDDVDLGQEKFSFALMGERVARHFDVELPPGVALQDVAYYGGAPTRTRQSNLTTRGARFENTHEVLFSGSGPILPRSTLVVGGKASFGVSDEAIADIKAGDIYAREIFVGQYADLEDLAAQQSITGQSTGTGDWSVGGSYQPTRLLRWRMEVPVPSPDALDIVTGAGSSEIELSPGVYGRVRVGSGHTVTFDPGTYTFTSLVVEDGGLLKAGPSRIFVHGAIDIAGVVVSSPFLGNGFVTPGWIVQVPPAQRDREQYGAPIQQFTVITGGLQHFSLLAGRLIMRGGASRIGGPIFTWDDSFIEDAKVLNVYGHVTPDCSSCEFSLGCANAEALDQDADGLGDCEEDLDGSGWTDKAVKNGVSTTLLRPDQTVLNNITNADGAEFLAERSSSSRAFQYYGWHQVRGGLIRNLDFIPGWTADNYFSQSSEPRVQLSEGYLYFQSRGTHCFRAASEAGALQRQWLYINDVPVIQRAYLDQDTTECIQLSAGIHRMLYASTTPDEGVSTLLYCYGGNGTCEPRLGQDYLTSNILRAYHGTGDIPDVPAVSKIPDPRDVPCDEDPTTCTELCPCFADSAPCDDGNACTIDICNYPNPGQHQYFPVDSDDGNACTQDACDPILGETHTPLDTGNVCSLFYCDPEDPSAEPVEISVSTPTTLDDDLCTIESCGEDGTYSVTSVGPGSNPCITAGPCNPATGSFGQLTYNNGLSCGSGGTCQSGLCLTGNQQPFAPGTVAVSISNIAAEYPATAECGPAVQIPAERVALIRGTVGKLQNGVVTPFQGAKVSVFGACEFGSVLADAEGKFGLPIEGGGKRMIRVEDPSGAFFSADREVTTSWGTGDFTGPVILLPKDQHPVSFDVSDGIVAGPEFSAMDLQGNEVSLGATSIYIPPETTFGSTNATSGTLQIAAFTSGASGPEQMPAPLPPGTDYTHAFDISMSDGSQPNSPLIYYFENFRGTPPGEECEAPSPPLAGPYAGSLVQGQSTGTGTCADYEPGKPIPHFSYNEETAAWEREDSGEIIVLDCTTDSSGTSVTGFGTDSNLDPSPDELSRLTDQVAAGTYACGQELWRVEMDHFSPHDFNWWVRTEAALRLGDHGPLFGAMGDDSIQCGSIIETESGALRESIQLPGIEQSLNYNSDAMFGYAKSRWFPNPFFDVAGILEGPLYWEVQGVAEWDGGVGGWPFFGDPSGENASAGDAMTWSGRDEAGRRLYGTFGAKRGRYIIETSLAGARIQLGPFTQDMKVHVHDAVTRGLGGWTLSGHHALHPHNGGALYRGDTGLTEPQLLGVQVVYDEQKLKPDNGDGSGYSADFAITRNGGVYYVRGVAGSANRQISYVDDTVGPVHIHTLDTYSTDVLALDPRTERLYVTDYTNGKIWVSPPSPDWSQSPPPTLVELIDLGAQKPLGIAVRDNGTVVVAVENPDADVDTLDTDSPEYRLEVFELELQQDGTAVLRAGPLFGWEGQRDAGNWGRLLMKGVPGEPETVVVGTNIVNRGSDANNNAGTERIFKWTPANGIQPLIWDGCRGNNGKLKDRMPAAQVNLYGSVRIRGLLPMADGRILYNLQSNDGGSRILSLTPTSPVPEVTCDQTGGDIPYVSELFAGPPIGETCGPDSLSSGSSDLTCFARYGTGLALGPDGEVWAYWEDGSQIARLAPVLDNGEHRVVSDDGSELFVFAEDGRHLETRDALDPSILYRSFTYDSSSKLLTGFTEQGRTSTVLRSGGNITIRSPFGHETVIATDPATGYATSIHRRADGEAEPPPIVVGHDAQGLLYSMVDSDGTHSYEYSDRGTLTSDSLESVEQGLDGYEHQLGAWATHVNGEGEESSYFVERGPDGATRRVVNSDGTGYELSTDYSKNTTVTQSDGSVIETTWGSHFETGAPIAKSEKVTLPDGQTVIQDLTTSAVEVPGTEDRVVVETASFRVADNAPPSLLATVTTDQSTNTRTVQSPLGRTVVTTYDDYGRPKSVQVGNLKPQFFEYFDETDPELGQLKAVWLDDPAQALAPSVAQYSYKTTSGVGVGYLDSITTMDGTSTFVRDGYGRAKSVTTDGDHTTMSYDQSGRLESVQEPSEPMSHIMSYAAHGGMKAYSPPSGEGGSFDTQWIYDDARRVKDIIFPVDSGKIATIHFDRDGLGTPHPGRNRTVTLTQGDSVNPKVDRIGFVFGDEIVIDGEPLGRPGQVHAITRGPFRTKYGWNGPLITNEETTSVPSGFTRATLDWDYDELLRVKQRSVAINQAQVGSSYYSYNEDSQLHSVGRATQTPDVVFDYDGDGHEGDQGDGHGLLEIVTAGNIRETFDYDEYGRLSERTVEDISSPTDPITLFYSSTSNRDDLGRAETERAIHYAGGFETDVIERSHTYDAKGQLQTTNEFGENQTHVYDAKGNRLCSYSAPAIGCTGPFADDGDFEYDEDNRLTAQVDKGEITYDAAGRLKSEWTSTGSREFDYDLLGTLAEYREYDGASSIQKRIVYVNDHQGRRIGRKSYNGAGALLDQRQYVWGSGLQIEAELDGDGNLVSRFVYGLRPNVPELVIRPNGNGGEDVYRVITDQRGSPVLVVNINDTMGDVLFEADYDVWGKVEVLNGNLGVIPHGFAGGLLDVDTGLVRFGARDYDPSVGRWTAKDPILFGGGQSNLYAYSFNDPVNFVDPDGRSGLGAAGALIGGYVGALIGGGAGLATGPGAVITSPAGAVGGFGIGAGLGLLAGEGLNTGIEALASGAASLWNSLSFAGEQDKVLTRGEVQKLIDAGYHPHDLKPKRHGSRYDLYKNPNGDVCVKPKGGSGEGDPTGINIKDL